MNNNQEKNNQPYFRLVKIGIVLIIIAIIFVLLSQMIGRITITQKENKEKEMHSIACEAEGLPYPYFSYNNSEKTELKINATFEENKLESISLVYILTYSSKDGAEASELKNHIDFELMIQKEGLRNTTLHSDHKVLDNLYQLTIYNSKNELNEKIAKYYLLDSLQGDYTQADVGNTLAKKGLNCINK
jgi:hypothetical protein